MKQLRDYQLDIANRGSNILRKLSLLYLAMEVRTGKTATSMKIAEMYGAKKVLFLTRKKAVSSILEDYNDFGYQFDIVVTNHESLHKLQDADSFDVIIFDEAHKAAGLPKPGQLAKRMRERFFLKPIIMLSGTMSPESFSQVYHQFWISSRSPWVHYRNFYKWAHDYVNIVQRKINSLTINDYSAGIEAKIMHDIQPYMITHTQEQSGFKSKINEKVLYVKMHPITYKICDKLIKDLVFEGDSDVILADTPAKLMQKLMQLYSGTCKLESGLAVFIDKTKAEFIREYFAGKKIGIFYCFKKELDLLLSVFGDEITTDLHEFQTTDKHFAGQVVSSREGISLKEADCLVFMNIQHSAVSYLQAIDRMTTMDRLENNVYWIFAEGGIEEKIYKVVKSKKKYTVNIFKKDYK
jgi:hypothetical protein